MKEFVDADAAALPQQSDMVCVYFSRVEALLKEKIARYYELLQPSRS